MRTRRTSKVTWAVTLLLAIVIGYGAWQLFFPHHVEILNATPADVFALTGVSPPAGAHDFRIARFQHFQQFAECLRFDAAPAICVQYAEMVAGAKPQPSDAMAVRDAAAFRPGAMPALPWFDLNFAQDVVSATRTDFARVWVDQTRGVFYYRRTD